MNSLINELVKKLRNVKDEEEAKHLSYELSDAFSELGITENMLNVKWLSEFFNVKIVVEEALFGEIFLPYEISRHYSSNGRRIILIISDESRIAPSRIAEITKFGATLLCFREELSEPIAQRMEFELPFLQTTKLSLGEKVFFYNLMCPCKKYLEIFERYWSRKSEQFSLSYNGLWDKWEGFMKYELSNRLVISPLSAVQVERFYHELLFEEVNNIWRKAKSGQY